MDKIKITGRGADRMDYRKLVNFQGDLKVLSEAAYLKIRASIMRLGFMEPISVWKDEDGQLNILNGHQRLSAVKRMVEKEGFEQVELPINFIEAENYQDAKLRVLALTSEYGEMTQDGAVNFMADLDIEPDEFQKFLELRQVNLQDVLAQLHEVKLELPERDELDIGNVVVGGDTPPSMNETAEPETKEPRNDPMSGLRLMQIFVTSDQLEDVKLKIDKITEHYRLENTTEAILKSVDVAFAAIQVIEKEREKVVEKPKVKSGKKSKK